MDLEESFVEEVWVEFLCNQETNTFALTAQTIQRHNLQLVFPNVDIAQRVSAPTTPVTKMPVGSGKSLNWDWSRLGPCSNIRTSMSTLKHSTLSVLNRYADLQMLVLFQMQYSVAHLTEMTSAARPCHPPNT